MVWYCCVRQSLVPVVFFYPPRLAMSETPTKEVLILGAARTAIGNLNGGLSSFPAHELGSIVMKEALQRAGVRPDKVSEVLMGQILTAGTWYGLYPVILCRVTNVTKLYWYLKLLEGGETLYKQKLNALISCLWKRIMCWKVSPSCTSQILHQGKNYSGKFRTDLYFAG